MIAKLWTRKCRDPETCSDTKSFGWHSHHLTWFGRLYFRWIGWAK